MSKTFILRVYRGTSEKQQWEEFELEVKPFYTITSCLTDIQKNPVNRKGERVTPIAWEQGCLEEVCGSCSMLINGWPRQACATLVDSILKQRAIIALAPLTKFPLIKDLVVDRSKMFEDLKTICAWIDVDDALDPGFGPKINPDLQEIRYVLSTCMTCGCCLETCPQVNRHSKFIGPAAISQARLYNIHPVGKYEAPSRLRPLMKEGGISDCGNAQNCRRVCPKKIPLTESITVMGRKIVGQAIKDMVSLHDVSEET